MEIITDTSKLREPSEPFKVFLDDKIAEEEKSVIEDIINKLKETFEQNSDLVALAAPQIGINRRIFGIKFNDQIKFFINPLIISKNKFEIIPETCSSLPGKEILIARPTDIRIVYTSESFSYEDNKLVDRGAALFDQMYNILDGVTPELFGLVSDPSTAGSIFSLSEEDFYELQKMYLEYCKTLGDNLNSDIQSDENLSKEYRKLKFSESVVAGKSTMVDQDLWAKEKARNRAINKMNKQHRKSEFKAFVAKKGK